ncbi:hypothetical protein PC116_g2396 [Phytophthora cactorum]|uniref:Uncharacterized protein n=1 Tax=Phytophthora cactorum TaxID=29920 RepID=A0A8T1LJS4_9STRA|nr:hypothetical protein PC114_g16412 [Phytophthora cactorum]KAG2927166.1 hypothetical protein PC117_g14657 [Phytophthora cactorum]KAG2980209.1 hypothetical protein PC119_g21325 [Phytophthora cactorum]KAG3010389.1 hypothetical protein PC120_g15086 [Phytophthora cactorum]KAG3134236.1 hypothetical protein C6341_g22245 [Phytophthora cactorum]
MSLYKATRQRLGSPMPMNKTAETNGVTGCRRTPRRFRLIQVLVLLRSSSTLEPLIT